MDRVILEKVAAHLAHVAACARVKRAYTAYLEKRAEPSLLDNAVTTFKSNPAAYGAGAGALLGGVLGGGSTAAANLFRKKEDRKSILNNSLLGATSGGALGLAGGLGYSASRAPTSGAAAPPKPINQLEREESALVDADRTFSTDEHGVTTYTSAAASAAAAAQAALVKARASADPAVRATVPALETKAELTSRAGGYMANVGDTVDSKNTMRPLAADGTKLPLPGLRGDLAAGLEAAGVPGLDKDALQTIQAGMSAAGVPYALKNVDQAIALRELALVVRNQPDGVVAKTIDRLTGTHGTEMERDQRRAEVMKNVTSKLSLFRPMSPTAAMLPENLRTGKWLNPFTWGSSMPSTLADLTQVAAENREHIRKGIEAARSNFKPQLDAYLELARKLEKHGPTAVAQGSTSSLSPGAQSLWTDIHKFRASPAAAGAVRQAYENLQAAQAAPAPAPAPAATPPAPTVWQRLQKLLSPRTAGSAVPPPSAPPTIAELQKTLDDARAAERQSAFDNRRAELERRMNVEDAAQRANQEPGHAATAAAADKAQAKAKLNAQNAATFNPRTIREGVITELRGPKAPLAHLNTGIRHNWFPRARLAALLGLGPTAAEATYDNVIQPLLYGGFDAAGRDSTALNAKQILNLERRIRDLGYDPSQYLPGKQTNE